MRWKAKTKGLVVKVGAKDMPSDGASKRKDVRQPRQRCAVDMQLVDVGKSNWEELNASLFASMQHQHVETPLKYLEWISMYSVGERGNECRW